jgi:hypothetical protein
MRRLFPVVAALALAVCSTVKADDKYSFHENLHVGQVLPFTLVYDCKTKSTATKNGLSTDIDSTTHYDWKGTLTMLAVKDGSATSERVEMDPVSSDTTTDAGQPPQKAACPFAGKTVIITRNANESFTNDFAGSASDDDTNLLNNFISPDEDFYPDHPVAIGDFWDVSGKVSKHSQLGSADRLLSACRLDWVKKVNGRQMAQISNSIAVVYHEPGHLEEDFEASGTAVVDIATQMIVKADQTGSSTFKTSAKAPMQMTGGTQSTYHCEILPK